jgi:hypothetical protein
VVDADATGLTLEWTAPAIQRQLQPDGTLELSVEGYTQTSQPGAPRLPFSASLIALPPGVQPRLRILASDDYDEALTAPLALAPHPSGVLRDRLSRPIGGAFAPALEQSGETPAQAALLEELGVVRGVRLARVAFFPALPDAGRLRITRRLQVRIEWADSGVASPPPSDPLLSAVKQTVLNPWDVHPAAPSAPASIELRGIDRPSGAGVRQVLIEIATSGLYRLTYSDLQPFDLVAGDPHNLRLFRGNEELSLSWEGDDDALFEPEEAVLFFANVRFSRWTATDVYRLVADTTAGLRVTSRSANPAGLPSGTPWVELLAEENQIYTPDYLSGSLPLARDGDRWTWQELSRPGIVTADLSFETSALDESEPATLTLWLIGYTDPVDFEPDHWVEVSLNDVRLGHVMWEDRSGVTGTLPIAAGILHSGPNTLTLALPGIPDVPVEGAWLDAFSVRYAHSSETADGAIHFEGQAEQRAYTVALPTSGDLLAYDATDPLHPQTLTDMSVQGDLVTVADPPDGGPRRYALADADALPQLVSLRFWEDAEGFGYRTPLGRVMGGFTGADLLIITHADFTDALAPLTSLRQAQGVSTVVVNVLGIYDGWGDGRPDPEAIRAYIADAYATWNPRPSFVLLVGDGSFDPKGYRAETPPTFIPPYLADVDPWAGETAADNRYVCVDGDDSLPDLLLGRLAVDTIEEAHSAIAKIVNYETDPSPGDWNANVLLVADDDDSAGDFAANSDLYAAAHVTAPFTVARHYCPGSLPNQSDCAPEDAQALHTALQANWNQGALLVQYTGHSSWHQWAVERLWHLDDVPGLYNTRRLPFIAEMTCFTGAFHRPEATLDEELVTSAAGGAIAVWGPTGLGVGTGHDQLSEGFFGAIFQGGATTTGEATLAGKLLLAASGQNLDLLDTFILVGDPALRLNLTVGPPLHDLFLPMLLRSH